MEEYKIPLEIFNCEARAPYDDEKFTEKTKAVIEKIFDEHQILAKIVSVTFGPTVTTFNVTLDRTVSPKLVFALREEIGQRLGKDGIHFYPNYEESVVCIEVPSEKRTFIELGELLQSPQIQESKGGELRIALGKDMLNRPVIYDLSKMVHMLVAGDCGSGKSVFLNSILVSLLYKHSPKELQLILIDPKMSELMMYQGLPHMLTEEPITKAQEAVDALSWAISEMDRRYALLDKMCREGTYVLSVDEYNQHAESEEEKLPKIVIVIGELADLMFLNKRGVENRIQMLTQKARAAGIYLIAATQRPSPFVLADEIKGNFLARAAFRVASEIDSRRVIDCAGAQELLGSGDYLYSRLGGGSVERMQAPYVSVENILNLLDYVKANYPSEKDESIVQYIKLEEDSNEVDPLYIQALKMVIEFDSASISMIQRKCAVGYNKADQIIQWMEDNGYISPFDGAKSRKVLMTMREFEEKFEGKGVEPEYIEALKFVVERGGASILILQRGLGMTFEEASKILEWMEENGYVSDFDGKNPRKVLITMEELNQKFGA